MRIVDVGCGTGDFTRNLAELAGEKCSIIGVDTRAASFRTATALTRNAHLPSAFSYRKGDVFNIPLPDEYAALTCCRTLLMHLTDPLKAVKEMARITKKDGTVAAIERGEMNNIFDPEDEEYAELAEKLGKAYLKGQRKVEGKNYAIGDRLPSIILQAGLQEIRAEVQAEPDSCGVVNPLQGTSIRKFSKHSFLDAGVLSESPAPAKHELQESHAS